jgi:hypothetical protein
MRVLAMVEEKAKGGKIEIAPAPAPQHGRVIDLMEALKKSMEKTPEQSAQAASRKKRPLAGIIVKFRPYRYMQDRFLSQTSECIHSCSACTASYRIHKPYR